MATLLELEEITSVGLVDQAANDECEVLLVKRDARAAEALTAVEAVDAALAADITKHIAQRDYARAVDAVRSVVEKRGAKISGSRLAKLKDAVGLLSTILQEVETMQDDDVSKSFDPASLSQEAQDHLASLEKRATDAEGTVETLGKSVETLTTQVTELTEAAKADTPDTDTDVLKGADAELRKRFEDLEKRASDAEAIATVERDARLDAEFTKRATDAGLPSDIGPVLKRLTDTSTADAEAITTLLKAQAEQIKAGSLFDEVGKTGTNDANANSAWGEIEKRAADLLKSGDVKTHAAGVAAVVERDAALYARHTDEQKARH
jgi:chaperonin cofactor prefoldin